MRPIELLFMEEFGGATTRVDPGNPNITSFEMEQF